MASCIILSFFKQLYMLFLLIFGALILAPLLVAFLMPGSYRIEKSIIINQAPETVMYLVGDLHQHSLWNPWLQVDKSAETAIKGSPLTKGQLLEWTGKKIGKGTLTVIHIGERHLHFEQRYQKPLASIAQDQWTFEPWGESEVKVSWQKNGSLPWPIARLMGPVISRNLAHQLEKGLVNLKEISEAASNKV